MYGAELSPMTEPISLFSRTISQMCPIFGHAPATGGAGVGLGVGLGVGFGVGLAVGADVAFAVAVAVGVATADGLAPTLDPGAGDDVPAGEPIELSAGPTLADEAAAISEDEADGEAPGSAPPRTDCSATTTAMPATTSTAMATGRRERRAGRSMGFSAGVPQSARSCRPKRDS